MPFDGSSAADILSTKERIGSRLVGKTSINPPVDSTNGQAAGALTGKSGGAGTFTVALAQSLARYRYVTGAAAAIL